MASFIDLFSGAGLFSHSFISEGFDCLLAVEINHEACETYRANICANVIEASVCDIEPIGGFDVLIAGPPCQGFSTLGKRDPFDERNGLSLALLPWVRKGRPSCVVVENVASFLDSEVSRSLNESLRRQGYSVDCFILNTVDFGAAQRRLRSFSIASRIGQPQICPLPMFRDRTVRDAFAGLSKTPTGMNHHIAPIPSDLAYRRMELIPEGGNKLDVMKRSPSLCADSWWRIGCQAWDAWGRLSWNRPANTIRTSCQNPSKGRYIHPSEHRAISIREAARLQSIPDNWVFPCVATQAAKQIGNSVPPAIGRAVASAIHSLF